MEKVLPIVIVCSAGILFCLVYIAVIVVKALKKRPKRKREFEIEENVLTVKLGKRKKKK